MSSIPKIHRPRGRKWLRMTLLVLFWAAVSALCVFALDSIVTAIVSVIAR